MDSCREGHVDIVYDDTRDSCPACIYLRVILLLREEIVLLKLNKNQSSARNRSSTKSRRTKMNADLIRKTWAAACQKPIEKLLNKTLISPSLTEEILEDLLDYIEAKLDTLK